MIDLNARLHTYALLNPLCWIVEGLINLHNWLLKLDKKYFIIGILWYYCRVGNIYKNTTNKHYISVSKGIIKAYYKKESSNKLQMYLYIKLFKKLNKLK